MAYLKSLLVDKSAYAIARGATGNITGRSVAGKCPHCDAPGAWWQGAEVWGEDGTPIWDECSAWHFDCDTCGVMSADPYEDGLIRVYTEDDDIEDWG